MSVIFPFMNSQPSYTSPLGAAYCGDALDLMRELPDNSIDLVITSPPFALQRKKEYGNKDQSEYVDWLCEFAAIVYEKISDTGSFVIDIGGAYQKGKPIRSLYQFRCLLKFCDEIGFNLAQEFYWHNPSKLPSPIEWVNKRKLRVKDSVNTVWWLSKSDNPKSNVSNVLVPYSDRMKKLLKDPEKFYSAKKRPSGHDISMGFSKDNGGAIPSNMLQIPNTESNGTYTNACKLVDDKAHPARFPAKLPEFFIKMLTDEGDVVLDIFAGSNTTGAVCERLNRKWLAYDMTPDYVACSAFRFIDDAKTPDEILDIYQTILNGGETINFSDTERLEEMPFFATAR